MGIVKDFTQIEFDLLETDGENSKVIDPELYENFGTINTCGDGNCFFHATVMITKVYNKAISMDKEKDFIEALREKISKELNIDEDYNYLKNDIILPLENSEENRVVSNFRKLVGNEQIINGFTTEEKKINGLKTLVELQNYDDKFYDELNIHVFNSFMEAEDIKECKDIFSNFILEKCKKELKQGCLEKDKQYKCNSIYKKYIRYIFSIIIKYIINDIKKDIAQPGKWIDSIRNTSQATLSHKYLQKHLKNNIIIIQKLQNSNNATVHVLSEYFDKNLPTMLLLTDSLHFERIVRKNQKNKIKYTSLFDYDDTIFIQKLYKIACEDDSERKKFLEKSEIVLEGSDEESE